MKNNTITTSTGQEIYDLALELWPINRSLTGEGVRRTLKIIKKKIPSLKVHEIKSGTKVFDWTIPKEWKITEAWIIDPNGKKICNFEKNNLHVLGYSHGIDKKMSLSELNEHLYSLPNQPDAIPYMTSYYEKRWGFCISDNDRKKLKKGTYKVFINADLFDGSLTYGELLIPGKLKDEIFLSTYVCHPSMANNEISGPCVTTFLSKWLNNLIDKKYSYRIIFIPETIGSIAYLSQNYKNMKKKTIAGFNISCVGDERSYSFLPSRNGQSISDKFARHILYWTDKNYISYNWSDRGSDERQYCAPGIDLPVSSIMRTKYHEYPEYHTSLDKLGKVVTSTGLYGGYEVIRKTIEAIEKNFYPKVKVLCEPHLSKRGLYPSIGSKNISKDIHIMMEFITWSDGSNSLIEIADKCNLPIWELYEVAQTLQKNNIIE